MTDTGLTRHREELVVASLRRLMRRLRGRAPRKAFSALRSLPRYRETVVDLMGHPFTVPDGPSFYASYQEIFEREIYRFRSSSDRPRIVDCGANVGLAVLYFKRRFPEAQITAVEADPEIFRVLEANLAAQRVSGVTLLNRAVTEKTGWVDFHVEGADAGRLDPLDDSMRRVRVEAIGLDELLEGPVDFLKIDVEGAETDLLCSARKLDRVASMFVEYHSFSSSPQRLPLLLSTLRDAGFRYGIQTQYCPPRPLWERSDRLGMDLQLNVFAYRPDGVG